MTIGITPTRAETGYGYIRGASPLSEFDEGSARPEKVGEFVEKPDAATARSFVESGHYFWNAGIFMMRASRLLEELEAASDEGAAIVETCRWLASLPKERWLDADVRARFAALPASSIDTAVMERSSDVAVIPAALEWSDVGSLLALDAVAEPDERGNVRVGRGVRLARLTPSSTPPTGSSPRSASRTSSSSTPPTRRSCAHATACRTCGSSSTC